MQLSEEQIEKIINSENPAEAIKGLPDTTLDKVLSQKMLGIFRDELKHLSHFFSQLPLLEIATKTKWSSDPRIPVRFEMFLEDVIVVSKDGVERVTEMLKELREKMQEEAGKVKK